MEQNILSYNFSVIKAKFCKLKDKSYEWDMEKDNNEYRNS